MSEHFVSVNDLNSVKQLIDGMPDTVEAPKALLSKLVDDIKDAMDDLTEVPVTIVGASDDVEEDTGEPAESIGQQFAGAFTAAASSHAVKIRLHKVHRA